MTAAFSRRVIRRLVSAVVVPLAGASALNAQPSNDSLWRVRHATDSIPDPALRWRLVRHNTLTSPGALLRTLLPAIAGQVAESPDEWNRTFTGFGQRFGARAAVLTSRDLLQAGTAAALGHDPRYQRCDCDGAWRRVGHAVAGLVLLSGARGESNPDPANLLAALGGGYVRASVYPGTGSRSRRTAEGAVSLLGQMAIERMALEFAPDIRTWFHRRRR